MITTDTPTMAGVHHLKLPVSDLRRSQRWYETRLGYHLTEEWHDHGELTGIGLRHPDGGPDLGLVRDPDRAAAAAGFDYFSIGVPDQAAIRRLADRLTSLGEEHAGVHVATFGWILPLVHDPDGHEVRFYTVEHHTEPETNGVKAIHDAVASAQRRAAELGLD